jgi:hypothetical protein
MNLIKLNIILFLTFFLLSCANYSINNVSKKNKTYFSSYGFALIYNDNSFRDKMVNKKLNNAKLQVMHGFLEPNTLLKIFNPINSKSVNVKITKNSDFPSIFNIVITNKVASLLELDFENPYVEVFELKKNITFVAKKANTYDEEKNVAGKAPVEKIEMDSLSGQETTKSKKIKLNDNFIILISDFYYLDSASTLKNELMKKVENNNFLVKKINNNKFRLSVGPFKNFNALKNTYISLNNLGFEDLNIYKN